MTSPVEDIGNVLITQPCVRKASSTTRTPYQYSTLNEDAQEIRVLTLLPGTFSSKVRVLLNIVPFAKEYPANFEALSYTWGSQDDPADIFVGESGSDAISVTKNLSEALPYLRYPDKVRAIWIDAICVNQQDLAERSSQVKRMADIYSSASSAIVWLGLESHDSLLAMQSFELISSKIAVDWDLMTLSFSTDEVHGADGQTVPPLSRAQYAAMCSLLLREWFKRLWIWQELILASATPIVLCGSHSIVWSSLRNSVFYLYEKVPQEYLGENMTARHKSLLINLCRMRGMGFVNTDQLTDFTKDSLCSDPRDRIFALLSLFPGSSGSFKLSADYTKTTSEVYQDFVRFCIKEQSSLRVLTSLEIQVKHQVGPSWVPNWSVRRITNKLLGCNASSFSPVSVAFVEDGVLKITGTTVATIAAAESFKLPESYSGGSAMAVPIELARIIRKLDLQAFADQGREKARALCRILCSNDFSETWSPSREAEPSLVDAEIFLREILSRSAEDLAAGLEVTADNEKFLFSVPWYCHGRSLFTCLDGTLGLAPRAARPGDKVVIWLGCANAMILRPVRDGRYQIVGEAYCGEVMEGETLLGHLPESFEPKTRFNERDNHFYRGYYDQRSGHLQVEDPRLCLRDGEDNAMRTKILWNGL